jgi:hypothetical protein
MSGWENRLFKADEGDGGDEGDGSRDQGWAVTRRILTLGRPKLIRRHRYLPGGPYQGGTCPSPASRSRTAGDARRSAR